MIRISVLLVADQGLVHGAVGFKWNLADYLSK